MVSMSASRAGRMRIEVAIVGLVAGLVDWSARLWNASKTTVQDLESSFEELTARFSEHGLYRRSTHQIFEPMHFDATNNGSHPPQLHLRSTPVVHKTSGYSFVCYRHDVLAGPDHRKHGIVVIFSLPSQC
jgi:hypothetical protein